MTLRDGLQDEAPVATADKVALYEALVLSGLRELELTSFVRPRPRAGDGRCGGARRAHRWHRWRRWRRWLRPAGAGAVALALNARGAERALAAGLDHLQFVVSVSEAHSLENAGRTPAAALRELAAVVRLAAASAAVVEVTLATAFGCPFTGPVPPKTPSGSR